MDFKIEEHDAFNVIGQSRFISFAEGGGMFKNFWNDVRKGEVFNTLQDKSNGRIPGMLAITTESNEDYSETTIILGVTTDETEAFQGLENYHFPASKWMIVEVVGRPSKAMSKAWDVIYSGELTTDKFHIIEDLPPFEAYIDSSFINDDSVNQIWLPVKNS